MPATLFHKVTESFAGALFVGHSEGDLLFLEQVAVRTNTPPEHVDAMVQALFDMKQLSSSTVAAPTHIVRFMGQVGIVTPYVEGVPLRMVQVAARAKRANCPAGVALKIVLDIVDGLCQYHNLGTALNGGVCPDHILVGSDGDCRVGNVAVPAMPTKDSPWRANVHRLAYLAPEQVSASRSYDGRTDVYAVAVILWELLSNQPRFIASAAHILETLRSADRSVRMAPLDTTRLAPGLVKTLEQALNPQASERQSSIGALARDLLDSGEEPAGREEVAKFVGLVADKPLREMRAAIRSQASFLKVRPPSVRPPPKPVLRSEPGAPPRVPRPSVRPANLPVDGEHTTVFHVTAELLEKARRIGAQSDAPPAPKVDGAKTDPSSEDHTVAFQVSSEMLEEANRTVTFQVPQELLEEARRMFESDEDAPQSISPGTEDVEAQSSSMAPVASPATLLRDLGTSAAPRAESGNRVPAGEEEVTALWRPDQPDESFDLRSPMAPNRQMAPVEASQKSSGWLWGLFLSLLVVLAWTVFKRLKHG